VAYVVTDVCINCRYGECIEVCPQNAFREGANFVVIDPIACSNCALCEMVCPVSAIYPEFGIPVELNQFIEINKNLSKLWPTALYKGPLEDADSWVTVSDKVKFLKSST
jgi:ferredoxin